MRHFSALCVVFQSFASFFNFIFIPSKIAACLASRSNLLSHLLFFCPAIIFSSSLSLRSAIAAVPQNTHFRMWKYNSFSLTSRAKQIRFACWRKYREDWGSMKTAAGSQSDPTLRPILFFFRHGPRHPPSPLLFPHRRKEKVSIWGSGTRKTGCSLRPLARGKKSEKGFVDDGRAFYFLCLRFHYRAP